MKSKVVVPLLGAQYFFDYPLILHSFFKAYFGGNLLSTVGCEPDRDITFCFLFGSSVRSADSCQILIRIPIKSLIRAAARSLFQICWPKSRTTGLFEYFVQLLRNSFWIDVERRFYKRNFVLTHAAVVSGRWGGVLLVAGSKGGKSTLSKLLAENGFSIHGDNYCFFDGVQAVTVGECRREGVATRSRFSFYGKKVLAAPASMIVDIDRVLILNGFDNKCRSQGLREITREVAYKTTYRIFSSEREGAFAASPEAVADVYYEAFVTRGNARYYTLDFVKDVELSGYLIRDLQID